MIRQKRTTKNSLDVIFAMSKAKKFCKLSKGSDIFSIELSSVASLDLIVSEKPDSVE